jgi:tetratricopeptide (TPR) repeat protein
MAVPGPAESFARAQTRAVRTLDVLAALLLAGLGFLLASTPARNGALWLHLASGRRLAQGGTPAGADPFSWTAADVPWVNHSWLADLGLYWLYQGGGGTLLVVGKALFVALVIVSFFLFRRRGKGTGFVLLSAGLSALALGPWLVLQPGLVSLLGVVLTLYLLERPTWTQDSLARPNGLPLRSRRWLLIPLFVLWANLDAWFLLGPVLVGLYCAGELLRWLSHAGQTSADPAARREVGSLLPLCVLGFAACLLTPVHYHTFALPTWLGLSHTEQVLQQDPAWRNLVVSPFSASFRSTNTFFSAGAWAYYVLLAGGAVSFVLRGRDLHPGRLLTWLALAALSGYQARTIAFFAAAGGPILALNLQEWISTVTLTDAQRRLGAALRGVGVLAGLVLLVLAWPGWLQPAPYQLRGWAVEPDPSMVQLAGVLESGHADGTIRSDRFAFTFSPDVAAYLAWFCPAEKGFLDQRWPLFDQVADDFIHMRRALLQPDGPNRDLGHLAHAHGIDRIILFDPDFGRTRQGYGSLLAADSGWDLLALKGSALLFGRRPPPGSPSPWKLYDRRALAYAPDAGHRAPPAPRDPRSAGPFDAFFRARQERSPDRDEAALHLLYFDIMAQRMGVDMGNTWYSLHAAGLVGSVMATDAAGTAGMLALRLGLVVYDPRGAQAPGVPSAVWLTGNRLAMTFSALHDRRPAEALLLCVRAARRALAANPDDAVAFLLLGEAYLRLSRQTRQQSWERMLPSFSDIRRVQTVTALEQAVLLRPDLERAHALLAQLNLEGGQTDAALDHLRARLDLARRRLRGTPNDTSLFNLSDDVEKLAALVQQSLAVYEANAADKDDPYKVFERARLAARHGLARKALAMLMESGPVIFGKNGTLLQLDLMLRLGRAPEVRAWLDRDIEKMLGFSTYHWLRAQAAAACGDYTGTDSEMELLTVAARQLGVSAELALPVRSVVALHVAEAVLVRPAAGSGPAGLAGALFLRFRALSPLSGTPAGLLRTEADRRVLRGVLALEAGNIEAAREQFRAALELWGREGQGGVITPHAHGAGLDFPGRPIAQEALELLKGTGTRKMKR